MVTAAASAFAGWTAVEVAAGAVLEQMVPGVVLDAFTVGLFLLFAYHLARSAPHPGEDSPQTDGGIESALPIDSGVFTSPIPSAFGSFIAIFVMMVVGEFGDKTQLITLGLAAEYGPSPWIWVGKMVAIVPVSLANAYLFHHFSHRFNVRTAHYVGAAIFAFFGVDTALSVLFHISVWETVVQTISGELVTIF